MYTHVHLYCSTLPAAGPQKRTTENTPESVSYTHLDVYKRQVQGTNQSDFTTTTE